MPRELWNNVLTQLETNINKQSFDMWLKDTEPVSISDNKIIIKVVDDVAKRHIAEHYSSQISMMIKEISGSNLYCEFVTNNGFSSVEKDNIMRYNPNKFSNTDNSSNNNISNTKSSEDLTKSVLNPKYTFDNFIVGQNNQLAHAASNAVSTSPATQFNPLFLYGGSGLGKTHLMQAIGHYVLDEKPYLKVLYVPTEQFINEFIQSIRTGTTESFKIKYRDVDILLIDDIQFIEKKEETQNEFFHTFNTLYDNKKQIVISSDRPPKQLSTLAERLRTRFEWGMITDIQAPNLETREAILKNKAEKENIDIPEDVLYYTARRIKSSIRALEGALSRLNMLSNLYNEPITINYAKMHLKDLFDDDSSKKINIPEIIKKVADKNGVTSDDIKSKSRQSRIIQPRFISMYLARKLTPMTTTDIGKEFGDRDHSTVLNAINKIEDDIEKDIELKEHIDDIIVELRS